MSFLCALFFFLFGTWQYSMVAGYPLLTPPGSPSPPPHAHSPTPPPAPQFTLHVPHESWGPWRRLLGHGRPEVPHERINDAIVLDYSRDSVMLSQLPRNKPGRPSPVRRLTGNELAMLAGDWIYYPYGMEEPRDRLQVISILFDGRNGLLAVSVPRHLTIPALSVGSMAGDMDGYWYPVSGASNWDVVLRLQDSRSNHKTTHFQSLTSYWQNTGTEQLVAGTQNEKKFLGYYIRYPLFDTPPEHRHQLLGVLENGNQVHFALGTLPEFLN